MGRFSNVLINCVLLLCLGTILGFFLISYQLDNDQVESVNGFFKTRYFFFRDWISSLAEVQTEKWDEGELLARIVENKEIILGNDTRLLQYIRDHVLIPPLSRNVPYDLEDPEKHHYSQTGGQTRYIMKSFENFIGGFFIEAGAYGGERFSDTLWLEKEKDWTGLLIEPESDNFETLKRKQRKAWLAHSCLSPNPYPQMEICWTNAYSSMHIDNRVHHVISGTIGTVQHRLPRTVFRNFWNNRRKEPYA
ncbi:unnamed protein product, partial [Darwinula stevensoni]